MSDVIRHTHPQKGTRSIIRNDIDLCYEIYDGENLYTKLPFLEIWDSPWPIYLREAMLKEWFEFGIETSALKLCGI